MAAVALFSSGDHFALERDRQVVPAEILRAFRPPSRSRECFDIANAHSADRGWYCTLNPGAELSPSFILYGDSHALQVVQAFETAARASGRTGIFTGFSGCPPLPGTVPLTRPDQGIRNCRALNDRVFEWAKSRRIEDIFLVAKWSYYTDKWSTGYLSAIGLDGSDPITVAGSRRAFSVGAANAAALAARAGSRLHVIAQVPVQPVSPVDAYKRVFGRGAEMDAQLRMASATTAAHQLMQAFPNEVWRSLADRGAVNFVTFDGLLCDAERCLIGTAAGSYYQDQSHLSADGAARLAPSLAGLLGQRRRH